MFKNNLKKTLYLSSAVAASSAGYSCFNNKLNKLDTNFILQNKQLNTKKDFSSSNLTRALWPQPAAEATYENTKDDLVDTILKEEFSGPLDKNILTYQQRAKYEFELKSRDDHMKELSDQSKEFDLLIVGGGANGTGVVLDAASRGLKCAVIDKYDFASGTSSKSTKMAHGGIRYFQQMMLLQGDPVESYFLLKDTLNERSYFLQSAPYLNKELALLIPSKSFFWTLFWYYPGAFAYHMLYYLELMRSNFQRSVPGPSILRKSKVVSKYPDCKAVHGQYGTMMWEAQMHDSRMNLNCLFTSSVDQYVKGQEGATLANYTEFLDYTKDENGKITGAVCRDTLNDKKFTVKAKVVVNCAGVHADELRQKDNPEVESRIVPSRGTHIMFKKGDLFPNDMGMIVPETTDGRLLFIINYFGHPMVGTTDGNTEATHFCEPTQEEIDFIIAELGPYFGPDYDFKGNLMSSWAGLRPLVKEGKEAQQDPNEYISIKQRIGKMFGYGIKKIGAWKNGSKKKSTAAISRNHVIEISDSGLVSLMGGKWTSFRSQGEETVDLLIKKNNFNGKLEPKYKEGQTLNFNLIGSYSKAELSKGLIQTDAVLKDQYEDYFVFHYDIPRECAEHLYRTHGTTALRVIEMGQEENLNTRLHPEYPFLKSEILYAIKHEMAEKPNDILCRRVPISFLHQEATKKLLPEVVEMLAKEKKWSKDRAAKELEEAKNNLKSMK